MEQTNHTDHLPNTEAIAAPQPARPDIFVNRELSWLEFNHRVPVSYTHLRAHETD